MDSELVTTEKKFEALAPSLEWFIPRLLQRGVDGQHCRRAAVLYLSQQQAADEDSGVDLVGRRMLAVTLQQYDGNGQSDPGRAIDNVQRLLRTLQPEELAQLIDQSVPPAVLEQFGRAADVLDTLIAQDGAGSQVELFDRLDEDTVTDVAMPFSETAMSQHFRSVDGRRCKHLSPADAERITAGTLKGHVRL